MKGAGQAERGSYHHLSGGVAEQLERRSALGQPECAGETEQPSIEGFLHL